MDILTRLVQRTLPFVTTLVMVAACVPLRSPRPGSPVLTDPFPLTPLTLLDTVVLPTITTPPDGDRGRWFGSLSGLALDPRTNRYLAVIDDRQPSRVAWLDITADAGPRLSVRRGEVSALRAGPGVDERIVGGADLEAIVALEDGFWIASEEGHVTTGGAGPPAAEWQPALLTFTSDLLVTRVQPWPSRFSLGPASGGVRNNQGFESLARMPDGRLIAGLEQPLYADLAVTLRNGRPFGGGTGGPSRLVELVEAGPEWQLRREWIYPLGPTLTRDSIEEICNDGETGLTDLLALDDVRLFALERSCLQRPGTVRNTARIYLVDLSAATDVAPRSGAALGAARPVAKTLLIDFEALIPHFPPALANLDNFEALAFGPPLPDGRRTLIVMSDDNFRPTQNTVFVWLEIEEAASCAGC